jgi:hypothetical protein
MRANVAATMMTMGAASLASAVQPHGLPQDDRIATRTLAEYTESSWLAPAAVVLDSKQAWDEWNAAEVASGRAVSAEVAPAGVDWKREVVLVVALGENLNGALAVRVKGAHKKGTETLVRVECAVNVGGSAPSAILALPRSHAHDVKLVPNIKLRSDMPLKATYVVSSEGTSPTPASTAASWGALKSEYR